LRGDMRGCAAITEPSKIDWTSARDGAIEDGMSFEPPSPRTSTSPSSGPSASPSSSPSASSSSPRARSQTRCRMRASSFADISAARRSRSGISTFSSLLITYAPFAPGAIAIASALASQRFLCQPDGLRLDVVKARHGVSHAGHPSGHPCGRPSGHPSGRLALWPKGGLSRAHCGFAGFRFCRHIYVATRSVQELDAPSSSACVLRRPSQRPAIASALATQRSSRRTAQATTRAAWCGADVGGAHAA
jgi:hypothetical protein